MTSPDWRGGFPATSTKPVAGKDEKLRPKCKAGWALLIRRVFPCDPLTCPRCGARTRIVAFLTEAAVIDPIPRHLEAHPPGDLFRTRHPPAA